MPIYTMCSLRNHGTQLIHFVFVFWAPYILFSFAFVVPGLLLSFAARFDAAKALVAIVSGGRGRDDHEDSITSNDNIGSSCCWGLCRYKSGDILSSSYFGPILLAYAIGLAMANIAVYVMNMGQPALLYLVPCCLGTMVYLGWKRQELRQLWEGPRVLETAEDIVFGRGPTAVAQQMETSGRRRRRQHQHQHNGEDDPPASSSSLSPTTLVEMSPKQQQQQQQRRRQGNRDLLDDFDHDDDDDDDEEADREMGFTPLLKRQQGSNSGRRSGGKDDDEKS